MSMLNSAIGWANFQITGGAKRAIWCMAGVAVLVPLLIFGSTQIEPEGGNGALRFWFGLLGVTQGAILGLFLPGRVHAAIKRDRASKLIESHRLMPMPASHAIAGYILGPNLLLLGCSLVVFALGLFLAAEAGQSVEMWVGMNVGMGVLALTTCCLVAFLSNWLTRLNPAILLVLIGPLVGIGSLTVVPALRVMSGSLLLGIPGVGAGTALTPELLVSFGSLLAFALILFVGACRRYRRDDVPALGFAWGFALLALWVGLTLFGILGPEPGRQWISSRDRTLSFVVSTAASMLLAIGPIASASLASLNWGERKRTDPHFADRRPMPVAIASVIVFALLSLLLIASPRFFQSIWPDRPMLTGDVRGWLEPALVLATLAAFVATVGLIAWAAGRLRVSAMGLLGTWIVVTWVLPPLADGARVIFSLDQRSVDFPTAIGAVSPPFGLGAIYFARWDAAVFGLVAQVALVPALVAAWFLLLRGRSRRVAGASASMVNA